MKLHEAMKACIDGNICRKSTTFENLTMTFDHDSGCFNIISDSGGRVSDFSYMGLVENWKLHKEPKFMVGDLVALKDKPKHQKYPLTTYIDEVMDGEKYKLYNRGFTYEESELTLILPSQELAEKIGVKE